MRLSKNTLLNEVVVNGGRLSSVLDINMREGNSKNFSGKATKGTVTAKVLLEGPIVKDKTTFLITGRRSMLDVFNKRVSSLLSSLNGMGQIANNMMLSNYCFYDYNAKVNHTLNQRNRIYFNVYNSKDVYKNNGEEATLNEEILWKNLTSSLRWNHIYSNSLFSNLTLYHTKYNYSSKDAVYYTDSQGSYETSLDYTTAISDYSAKLDFNYNIKNHTLTFGGHYLYQNIKPAITAINEMAEAAGQPYRYGCKFGNKYSKNRCLY